LIVVHNFSQKHLYRYVYCRSSIWRKSRRRSANATTNRWQL